MTADGVTWHRGRPLEEGDGVACGNNKVSRSGLHTQPVTLSQPVLPTLNQGVRERAVQAAKNANERVGQAAQELRAASSASAVRSALRTAQRALDDARRAGGDRLTRGQIRDLEKQVEQLRRQATEKTSALEGQEVAQLAAIRDSLGRQALGVPVLRLNLALVEALQRAPIDQPAPKAKTPHVESTTSTPRAQPAAVVSSADLARAEAAATQAGAKSLDELVTDKKATQRVLSAALRAKAPDAEIALLKEALRIIQRAESKARSSQPAPRETGQPEVIRTESGSKGAWNELLRNPPSNATIVVDELFVYETDSSGRTVRAQTVIGQVVHTDFRKSMEKWQRNESDQRSAGGADRLPKDDGGHLFATLFGGPGEGVNINAMDLSINRGPYEQLEKLWEKQADKYGGIVNLAVDFHFDGASARPDSFTVTFDMGDGDSASIPFYQ